MQTLLNFQFPNKKMITFRKHERKDIPYRVQWFNNPEVNRYLRGTFEEKTSLSKEKEWFSKYEQTKNKKFFTICQNEIPIGIIGISHINKTRKSADIFIAIGENNSRGKGIGKTAMLWIMNYGCKDLKLQKLTLSVMKDNIPAVRLYKSLGFQIKDEVKKKNKKNKDYSSLLFMLIKKEKFILDNNQNPKQDKFQPSLIPYQDMLHDQQY
ncbi:MAG: pseudaminic acid biosynthesis N-acetyl transferase [archaeon GW2011_AR17]|nr:MAG: pseudaminic acid biosynthesis N-acetyl transferase [archaeon GW2011_AR17]